jgi:hypothetical protein
MRASRLLAQVSNFLLFKWPSKTFWTWEVYGLGHSLKDVLGIAQRKKICAGSDHGITFDVAPIAAEVAIPARIHVTWSKWRTSLEFPDNREVIRIQHPWIAFRKKHAISRSKNATGTLVFVPHSVPGSKSYFDLKGYVNFLSLLPQEFHPLVFCLHMHDVERKTIRHIQKEGFSVVTTGSSLHPRYIRRFYGILKNFKYATSSSIGSQLFYCHEFGIKYFLYDHKSKFQRSEPFFFVPPAHEYVLEQIEKTFGFENLLDPSLAKDKIVNDALGLDLVTFNFIDQC